MSNIAGDKKKGERKIRRIPIAVAPAERLKKPHWIRVRAAARRKTARFVCSNVTSQNL